MNIPDDFKQVLMTADYRSIAMYSAKQTEYLNIFQRIFKLQELHKFCAQVDAYLSENDITPIGVHCQLNGQSMGDIMYRLRDLGLWPIYLERPPLETCIDILSERTLPQLVHQGAYCDVSECGYCFNKQSFKV